MRIANIVITGALLIGVTACGGSSKKPATAKATPVTSPTPDESPAPETGEPVASPMPDGEHHEDGEGGEDHDFAVPEMKAFHDVLHPLWHDSREKKDWTAICAGSAKLAETAAAVKIAKVPANLKDRKARFTQLGEKLADKAEDMHDQCDPKNGDATLDALTKVHPAFEDLMHLMH